MLGLKWEDIDLEGHRLFVRRGLWRGKFVTPKSRRSRRTIDVAPTLRDALARLPSRFRGDLVFCSEPGTALDPDNLMHRDFPRALRRAGVRRIRFHDLRHTYMSFLIAQGAHPKYIQVQLGHASVQTTLDRYGHLMSDAHTAEARKLDQLYSVLHRVANRSMTWSSGCKMGADITWPALAWKADRVGVVGEHASALPRLRGARESHDPSARLHVDRTTRTLPLATASTVMVLAAVSIL